MPMWKPMNELYLRKKEAVEQSMAAHDWDQVIWLHERPYRLSKLEELFFERSIDSNDLVRMLPGVWTDAEPQDEMRWRHLFEAAGFCTDAIPEKLAELRSHLSVVVYRGGMRTDNLGLAWSLSRPTAEWFAYRFLPAGRVPYLWTGEVDVSSIYAYIVGRSEEEIVVDPAYIRDIHAEKLPKKR